jgi:hypothetical protein
MVGVTSTMSNTENQYTRLLEQAKLTNKVELPTMSRPDTMRNEFTPGLPTGINENIKNYMQTQLPKSAPNQQSPLSNESITGIQKLAEEAEKAKKAAENPEEDDDDYFYDSYGTKIRNIHLNKKRRAAIESRCSDISISDLLSSPDQTIEQLVPIVPGKFEVVFRSISGKEDLLIKAIMAKEERAKSQVSVSYVLAKMGLLNLTCSLIKINDRVFPGIKGADGKPSEELLLSKFDSITNYPVDILADLGANQYWFSERVKQLSSVDNILNF